MPTNTYGKYITILGLDTYKSNSYQNNFDIGKLIFNGIEILSCLTLDQT
ncbi:unnamed protein product [Moneuplotes crassus]|uniref:Uncharacterized protein n=1 Tax=Euplotes crassus TaxID=5936 RepID=A0AAD1Y4E9_EUPCR|nr:unnamed protein product [Moneuplotes crassus]